MITVLPVRKIPLRYSSLSGYKYSDKSKRVVFHESSLEADFIELMEWNKQIWGYEEQPYKIEYLDEKKKIHSYIPDFLVHYKKPFEDKGPTEIVYEIKYAKDLILNKEVLKPKFLAANEFCKKEGFGFKVITEREIRTPYLQNVKFLKKYRKRDDVHIPMIDHLMELLKEFGVTTPNELVSATSQIEEKRAMFLYALWVMVAHSMVMIDMTKKITMTSKIWLPY
jgi:hypothetical protein